MVDFNNLLSRFVLAAPRALNDEVAQGQMVVCTQMSIAGSAASFTVKIMNAGTGRDLAEQLAQPLIKGLLGLTASAAELAAATPAEQSVHATKTYTARQTARFYPGWRDWKTAFEQAAVAPRPQTDRPTRAVPDLPRQGRSRFSEPRLLSRCFASCLPLGQWPLVTSRRPKC